MHPMMELAHEIKRDLEAINPPEELKDYWRYQSLLDIILDFENGQVTKGTNIAYFQMMGDELDHRSDILDKLARLENWVKQRAREYSGL